MVLAVAAAAAAADDAAADAAAVAAAGLMGELPDEVEWETHSLR